LTGPWPFDLKNTPALKKSKFQHVPQTRVLVFSADVSQIPIALAASYGISVGIIKPISGELHADLIATNLNNPLNCLDLQLGAIEADKSHGFICLKSTLNNVKFAVLPPSSMLPLGHISTGLRLQIPNFNLYNLKELQFLRYSTHCTWFSKADLSEPMAMPASLTAFVSAGMELEERMLRDQCGMHFCVLPSKESKGRLGLFWAGEQSLQPGTRHNAINYFASFLKSIEILFFVSMFILSKQVQKYLYAVLRTISYHNSLT